MDVAHSFLEHSELHVALHTGPDGDGSHDSGARSGGATRGRGRPVGGRWPGERGPSGCGRARRCTVGVGLRRLREGARGCGGV